MLIFDYMYLRLARFFFKKDGSFVPRAIGFVLFVQLLILWSLIPFTLSEEDYSYLQNYSKQIVVLFLISTLGLNYWGLNNKYRKYSEMWRDSETLTQRKIRGWLVVLLIQLMDFRLG